MKDLREYLEDYPCPPPVGRGNAKAFIGFNLTQDEREWLTNLVNHPDAKFHFNGNITNLMRWMIYYVAQELEGLIRSGDMVSLGRRLLDELRVSKLEMVTTEIDSFFDTRSRELVLLLDAGITGPALDLYDQTLKFIQRQPAPWNAVLIKKLFEHHEVERFRSRAEAVDIGRLSEIERGIH